ncbi:hypothetical protein ACFXPR_16475 [Nocardia tengchongensis]|uniref:hypothetical protein n=1 Tax=Nocardia tengchongensis TaxID=2055889 RepID=UPI0036AC61EA
MNTEITKLARVLRVSPDRINYLEAAPARELRQIRAEMIEAAMARNAHGLRRIAATARVLPATVVAKITERNRSPLLTALLAGVMDSDQVAGVARHLSPEYLVEVVRYSDPASGSSNFEQLPDRTLQAICTVLTTEGDFVTLGYVFEKISTAVLAREVNRLDDSALLAAMRMMDSDFVVYRVLPVLVAERRNRLSSELVSNGECSGVAASEEWTVAIPCRRISDIVIQAGI